MGHAAYVILHYACEIIYWPEGVRLKDLYSIKILSIDKDNLKGLDKVVKELISKAVGRAKADGRKTVRRSSYPPIWMRFTSMGKGP